MKKTMEGLVLRFSVAIVVLLTANIVCAATPQVTAGDHHTVAIKSEGTLWAWGWNYNGELGDGTMTERHSPVRIGSDCNWEHVAAGPFHTVATKSNGTLWVWGNNDYYRLGLGYGQGNEEYSPVQVGTDSNWEQVAAGTLHTVATKSNGTLWAWGWNEGGQLGDGTWFDRDSPVQIGSASDWEQVAAGQAYTLAIKSDGTLWAWGENGCGQLGVVGTTDRPSPVKVGTDSNWEQVAAGAYHTVAIKSDGTLWAWGKNDLGQLGDGTTTERHSPVQIGTDSNWEQVAAGQAHIVAIKSDGTLWAWGWNRCGELGDGTTTKRHSPVQIGLASNWEQVAAKVLHTVAIKSNGTLWAWGDNSSGQLGDGTTTERHSPVLIFEPTFTPTVAQSPMSGPPGTVFIQWGTGFSPNGTVNIHIRKPNGTEYLPQTKRVDSNGNFEVTYVSQPDKPTGQYSWWAEDVNTGAKSNEVTYTVFAPSSQPPNAPKFLLLNSGSKLVISWTPVLDAKGYLFLYAPYLDVSYIGNIDMGTNTYLSGELPEGSAFYGAVVAYNDAGFGELSNIEHFVVGTEICRAPFKGDGYFRIVNPTCEQRWKAFSYLNFESKRIRFLVKLLSGVVDGTIKVNELANILVEIGETVVSIRNLLGMSTGPIEDILTEGGFTIAGLDATLLNQELAQIWLNALESVLAGNPAPMVATAISTRINMFSIMGLSIETKILNSLTVAQTYLLDYYRFGEDEALLAQHYNLSSSAGISEVLDAVADRLSIDPGWFGFGRDYYRLGTKMMIDYLKNKVNQHAGLF